MLTPAKTHCWSYAILATLLKLRMIKKLDKRLKVCINDSCIFIDLWLQSYFGYNFLIFSDLHLIFTKGSLRQPKQCWRCSNISKFYEITCDILNLNETTQNFTINYTMKWLMGSYIPNLEFVATLVKKWQEQGVVDHENLLT